MTTATAPAPNLAARLAETLLRGRKIAPAPKPTAPSLPTPQEAKVAAEAFAAMLDRLATERAELDRLADLTLAVSKTDLAALVQDGKPLPDVGGIATSYANAKVTAPATLEACNRMVPAASLVLQVLRGHIRSKMELIEADLRSAMVSRIPKWMEAKEQEVALRSSPAWERFLQLKQAAPAVHLPLVLCGPVAPGSSEMKTALDRYRVAPRTDWERKVGDSGDAWTPEGVAFEIRAFLAHVARVEETTAQDLLA